MSVRSIDVNLGEHWELYAVFGRCKRLDLFIRARFLPVELIAGEGQNLQALFFELLVELHHFAVVPVREASLARDIDDHDTLLILAKLAKLAAVSIYIICLEFKQTRNCRSDYILSLLPDTGSKALA